MEQALDISEVVRRTGLTSRALRFYEARGLLKPLRTYSGRRLYGQAELERVNAILALKRAGFSLAAIHQMLNSRHTPLEPFVRAQLDELELRVNELAETRVMLTTILSRIDSGERIDVATLCSLIKKGNIMEQESWKKVTDRYFTPDEQTDFAASMAQIPADFDQADYSAKWKDLGGRIAAALPLDPTGEQAGAFVREWFGLLEPFTRIATPAMMQGVTRMYENMDQWQDHTGGQARPDPGFSAEVFKFIQQAAPHHHRG